MDDDLKKLQEMITVLLQDVTRCYDALDNAKDEDDRRFWARTTVRAVFAAVGGSCEYLCSEALKFEIQKLEKGHVSLGTLSVLSGETYYVADDGEIRWQPIRISLKNHILFALNSYAEAHGVIHRAKKNSKGWQSLCNAIKVRDDITHPKSIKALQITPAQILDVREAFIWFHNQLAAIFREKSCDMPDYQDWLKSQ
ncbi:MAG: hypothetical protein JWQ71_4193 [Pedosphaera sp.]|nr:hypothetical protein [Pedosphaera sp.]